MRTRFNHNVGLILLSGTFFLFTSCAKENDKNTTANEKGTPVIVKGMLDSSCEDVSAILAISADKEYEQVQVSGNGFEIELENSQPWGLVFLNAQNQPLGLLSLGNGIETLPLHYLSTDIEVLDLKTISRSGTSFTPSSNPIGNTIPLTPEKVSIIGNMDDYLAAMLNNPDADGNGKIDLTEGRSFTLSVIYFIKPGNFHVPELTPSLDNTTLIEGYRLFLTVEDASYPENVYFSGPNGSPLSTTTSESCLVFDDSRVYATPYLYDLEGNSSYVPIGGTYTVSYGDEILTFKLPDQSGVDANIVYPYPTLTLNGDGTLNKVDWEYRLPSGTTNFAIEALIDNIMVQLDGQGEKCEAISDQNGLYGSGRLSVTPPSHTFACQNIAWGNTAPVPYSNYVERLMMTYEDHYKTSYVVMYEKVY